MQKNWHKEKKEKEKFGMTEAKTLNVPVDPHVNLQYPNNDKALINVPYREALGSLMFLAIVFRPDTAFAVGLVSRFVEQHDENHWQAVKRIFRYLLGTITLGFIYKMGGSNFGLAGYSDADFAGEVNTRRSTFEYLFLLAGGPVTWSSRRQRLVTLSTTEAEYVAAADAAKEIMWLRQLLRNVGCDMSRATVLRIDNQSSIKLIKNPEYHKRMKHIVIRHHFIREKVKSSEIETLYVPSDSQLADIFTKTLAKERFICLHKRIGMGEI